MNHSLASGRQLNLGREDDLKLAKKLICQGGHHAGAKGGNLSSLLKINRQACRCDTPAATRT